MSCIATFDIGTTAVKAVLVGEKGEVIARLSREIPTRYEGGEVTQRPEDWWEAFRALSAEMLPGAPEVLGIVMSGQMQDVIPVAGDLSPVCPAILYSDGRAEAEAEEIRAEIKARAAKPADGDPCLRITGNHCDGTLSLPKVLWLKRHAPEMYEKTRCFLISSKDYVIARLTGETVGDYTACSTAGGMDLEKKVWSGEILAAAGVAPEKMPRLLPSHGLAGRVTPEAAAGTGYPEGTPVYAGVGDAGATTLASGIVRPGQYNINLGTSGWVATVSEGPLFNEGGIFNLAAMPEGRVINVQRRRGAGLCPYPGVAGQKRARGPGRVCPAVPGGGALPRGGSPGAGRFCGPEPGNPAGGSDPGDAGGRGLLHPPGHGNAGGEAPERLHYRGRRPRRRVVSDAGGRVGTAGHRLPGRGHPAGPGHRVRCAAGAGEHRKL